MKIQLKRNYSTYLVNAVIDCEDVTARRLLSEGIAVRVIEPGVVETAAVEPATQTADLTPRRHNRDAR